MARKRPTPDMEAWVNRVSCLGANAGAARGDGPEAGSSAAAGAGRAPAPGTDDAALLSGTGDATLGQVGPAPQDGDAGPTNQAYSQVPWTAPPEPAPGLGTPYATPHRLAPNGPARPPGGPGLAARGEAVAGEVAEGAAASRWALLGAWAAALLIVFTPSSIGRRVVQDEAVAGHPDLRGRMQRHSDTIHGTVDIGLPGQNGPPLATLTVAASTDDMDVLSDPAQPGTVLGHVDVRAGTIRLSPDGEAYLQRKAHDAGVTLAPSAAPGNGQPAPQPDGASPTAASGGEPPQPGTPGLPQALPPNQDVQRPAWMDELDGIETHDDDERRFVENLAMGGANRDAILNALNERRAGGGTARRGSDGGGPNGGVGATGTPSLPGPADTDEDRSRGQQQADALGVGDALADKPGYYFRVRPGSPVPEVVRRDRNLTQLALRSDGDRGYMLAPVGAAVVTPQIQPLPDGVSPRVDDGGVAGALQGNEPAIRTGALQRRTDLVASRAGGGAPDSQEARAREQAIKMASSQVGETSAAGYVRSQFPGAERVFGDLGASAPRSGEFDQIWRQALPGGRVRYIVAEAKGGTSGLGTAVVGGRIQSQGTPDYFDATVQTMVERYAGTPNEQAAQDLLDVRATGRVLVDGQMREAEVSYLQVRTPIVQAAPVQQRASPSTQTAPATSARQFDIRRNGQEPPP